MFVQSNDLKGIKSYFYRELSEKFSESEINLIVKVTVCNRLNISSNEYLLVRSQKFSESDLLHFRSIVKRLKNDEPFQYVVGSTEFFGLEIKTDHRALIPRPETEELVSWALELYDLNSAASMMDICGGSGCIALALKDNLPNAKVSILEFDKAALSLIRENMEILDLDIQIIEGDALTSEVYRVLKPGTFDCWISNPPYIPFKDKSKMARNVLDFEPGIALFVEDDAPLVFYRSIAREALLYLKNEGRLFFEIHEDLKEEVVALLTELGFVNIEVRKDLQGKYRMVQAIK